MKNLNHLRLRKFFFLSAWDAGFVQLCKNITFTLRVELVNFSSCAEAVVILRVKRMHSHLL